ncbi:MAG: SDR family oxidoreductase [Scrofimicrobium sp.]
MELGLYDRRVLVTGGSRGVGRGIVLALLDEGAFVSTCARNKESLDQLISDAGENSDRLFTVQADALDPTAMGAFVREATDQFGGVDGLVVNAGAGNIGGVLDSSWEDFEDQFQMKVGTALAVVRPAIEPLRQSTSPSIVIINGITAYSPDSEMAAVSVSRAALSSLATLLATDLVDQGIRVNQVNLGPIVTDRQRERHALNGSDLAFEEWVEEEGRRRGVPLGRMGTVDEVVPWILLALSPRSSFTTKARIDVSGGL